MSGSDSASNELICVYPGCKSSGRIFKRSYELERHKLIHFPSKKLACPIQDCKHKKKGKTFTRDDKFREHIAAHGELALFRCPVSNCKVVQVKNGDFASHVADDHNILERYEIKSFLNSLRISLDRGRWACPLLCDFTATSGSNVDNHLSTHDLIERVEFKSSIRLVGLDYNLSYGKASCPICNIQVCEEVYIRELCHHIVNSHDSDEMILNGVEIAKLLGHLPDWVWMPSTLKQVIRRFMPIQVSSSTLPPPISGSSSGKVSSRSSAPPTNLESALSAPNVDREAYAENSSSGCIGELPVKQVWNLHWTTPLQSSIPPETGMAGHNLPTEELSISGQDMRAQQNLNPPQTFLQPHGLIAQQNFPEPHSFIQPQGFVIPQTFMSVSVSQNAPVVSTFIPPFIFQGMTFWQPVTNSHLNMGFGQHGHDGYVQWPLQPDMAGYRNENQRQNMGPLGSFPYGVPDERRPWPDMLFDGTGNESIQ